VTYGSADRVEKYVVFNVGGNKYRLIAIVSYPKGKVYIQHVLTHKEYDRGTWKGD
jgi:mRNA interferase HigB